MKLPYAISLVIALAFLGTAVWASAAVTGPEFYISSKGEARVLNATMENRNAVNLFSVMIWGQRWTIAVDNATRIEDAGGTGIDLSQILKEHLLEIKGPVVYNDINRRGWVEARLVRDLSLGTPPPSVSSQAAVSSALAPALAPASAPPAPAPSPTPAPAPAPTAKKILTQNLRLGMRGREVVILQEFLQKNNWGIPSDGPVTGYYGKVTVSAVKKFQAANGLPPEGEVGPKTRKLINEFLEKAQ